MGKKWIKAVLWLAGIFLGLIVLFATVLYFNRDEITRSVVTEINSLLEAPVQVEKIETSLQKFPYASLRFSEVFCTGANASASDTLIHAEEMFFEFHLWKVLFGDLSIDRISFSNGSMNVRIPEEGIPNYQIWKSTSDQESTGLFTLEKVYFNDFKLQLWHGAGSFRSFAKIDELIFSGSFDSERYEIETSTGFFLDSLSVSGTNHLSQVPVSGNFSISGTPGKIRIHQGTATVAHIPLSFSSDVLSDEVTVESKNEEVRLADLIDLVETQNWATLPEGIEADGKVSINFSGHFPDDAPIDLKVAFETLGAKLSGIKKGELKNIAVSGTYQFANEKDELRISRFKGSANTGTVEGSLLIEDFEKPWVVLDVKSDLELQEWLSFMPVDTITEASGRAIVNLHLENRFRSLTDIQPSELGRAKSRGQLKFEQVGLRFKNTEKEVEGMDASLKFDDNDLRVNNFFFRLDQSDIYLKGTFGNVFNYIFFADEKLAVNTQVRSQELRLEDFISSGEESSPEDGSYDLSFAKNVDLDLRLEVDQFYFEKFYASHISGRVLVGNGVIQGRSLRMNADDGSFSGNFSIDTKPTANYLLTANLSATGVDMRELFVSFNNFGQEEILAEHIHGKADAELRMTAAMLPNLKVDPASVDMQAELSIAGGKLTDYEPMLALSAFAEIDELKDVRFDHLENTISIKNSEINIPWMEISSNVMNLSISGLHRFDNSIDYSMKLKLSDVLFSKRKSNDGSSEFDRHIVEVESEDHPYIYIRMAGPAADPEISLDKKNLGRSIGEDLKEQGREIKKIFSRKKQDKSESSGIKYDLFGEDEGSKK